MRFLVVLVTFFLGCTVTFCELVFTVEGKVFVSEGEVVAANEDFFKVFGVAYVEFALGVDYFVIAEFETSLALDTEFLAAFVSFRLCLDHSAFRVDS